VRKLFNEFFYIPQHGKVREKVMLTRLASLITIVIFCLAAMNITAYAYFSYNVTSGSNIIRSATFKTEVQVQITDSNGKAVDTVKPITSDYKSFKIEGLTVGETYTISVAPIKDEKAAKTGFVIVTADNYPDTYYTQQLGKDEKVEGGETNKLSFRIMITDSTTVYLSAHWGTSSYYDEFQNKAEELYITQDETIKLIVNGFDEPNVSKDNVTGDTNKITDDTTPPSQTDPITTPSNTITTPSGSTGASETTTTTESATTETTTTLEQTEPPATTETQSTEESVDTPTTEASE
jgi:sporulation protein YlmC with PRC-barrel domain